MLKIKLYDSMLASEPAEQHETELSLHGWLQTNAKGYDPIKPQPVQAEIDGAIIPCCRWGAITNGTVDLRVKQQGGKFNPFLFLINPALALTSAALGALSLSASSAPTRPRGESIESATTRANTPKLNQAIPELAGRFRRYPDYLTPPHRYFEDKTTQWVEFLACVGVGRHQINSADVFIGDSKLIALGDAAEFTIYEPGDDLSTETAADWWHSASEVGATSDGKAGLKLSATSAIQLDPGASSYLFNGNDIDIPSGAGAYPAGWTGGLKVRVEQYLDYTVTGAVISGAYMAQLEPFVGMVIEIAGDNLGMYKVGAVDSLDNITITYDDGSPVAGLLEGPRRMAIGYRGLLYETIAASMTSISVERLTDTGATDSGWGGFDTITTNDAVLKLDASNVEGGWLGPFSACPQGEETQKLEVDFFFPGGLIFTGNKELYPVTVVVEVQYRDVAIGGAWTSVMYTYTDLNANQFAYTETIDLGSVAFRPEVRVRRIGADATDTRTSDDVQWYGLRSQLTPPTSYEGVTTIAVKVRSSDRLAAQSENKLSVIATRALPTRSGGMWTIDTPTRSITAFAAYIAKSIGYTDDQIDLAQFDELETIWAARGDRYDWVHDEGTVSDALEQVLQAGFARLTIERGQIRPVRDGVRSVYEQMYTPQNMTQALQRSLEAVRPDDSDGVDVEFVNAETWTSDIVESRLPGDLGVKVDKIKIDGVTDRTKAWRIGMRKRREIKYRRWAYSFATEMDALNSRYLSYVALADDVPGYGKSAILQGLEETSDGYILTVSEPMEWTSGDHIVAIRNPDGTLNGPYEATQGADEFEIIADLSTVPVLGLDQEPPQILFGTVDRWVFPSLVTSIKPSGAESVSVQAVNYDARVYADDDNSPP